MSSLFDFLVQDGDKWRTNKFADASRCPVDASSDMRIWERRLLYCIPVSFHFDYFLIDSTTVTLSCACEADASCTFRFFNKSFDFLVLGSRAELMG